MRVPRTSPRRPSGLIYAKILRRVAPRAATGFGYEGTFVRPGAEMPLSDLGLADGQRALVLLECAGNQGRARGHVRTEQLYVLWSCDLATLEWRELARALAPSWQWAAELAPIARQALREARGPEMDVLPPLADITARIAAVLDHELESLEAADRVAVIAALHDQVAARLASIDLSLIANSDA